VNLHLKDGLSMECIASLRRTNTSKCRHYLRDL